jgi:hypothetical protein
VRKTWAISKGLKPIDGNFEDFMKVEFFIPKVHDQKDGWACKHQVVANLATYVKSQGTISELCLCP